MDIASEFHTKLLSRKRSAEEYRVYRAGLEWDLTDPIVIDGPEDFKSTQGWRDRLTPYRHQVSNLVTLPIHVEYIDEAGQPRLRPLAEILDGVRRNAEEAHVWSNVSERVANAIGGGKCIIEAAVRSPSGRHLAACSQVKTMMGLRVHHVGAIFELSTNSIVGRVSSGKRSRNKWIEVER